MKKLLSLLTISTLVTSVPAPLLANTVQTRVNHDVGVSKSNNEYLPINQISGLGHNVISLAVDSKNNIYFGTNNGAFVLNDRSDTATKINGITDRVNAIAVDSKDNVYFGIGAKNGAYVLKKGSDTATKINGINRSVDSIVINYKKNIIYFVVNSDIYYLNSENNKLNKLTIIAPTAHFVINSISVNENNELIIGAKEGAFVLKRGSKTPTKINEIKGNIRNITFSIQNNIYFSIDSDLFVLKKGATTPTKINGIDKYMTSFTLSANGNIYIGTKNDAYILQTALSWAKTQSHFTLASSETTMTWTHPDLIAVDGELNIDIANPNIDKVVFDNVQKPQTNKHWNINVKPETAPRDHNLLVIFTLDGKQYISEIIVSMQAKIDPKPTPVQQNLSYLIKTTDLGNIIDNNNKTIINVVNQKNSNVVDDFFQITIEKKDDHSATLTAKKDSKSYKGSVDVTYNVVSATVVDLQIDVIPSAPDAIVVKDYLGQIDDSDITNKVSTFYYANSESVITLIKPTASIVITGVVYGCDELWNKTEQSSNIDPKSGIKLDGSQLATKGGKYVIELSDNLGHTNNVYLQINEKKKDIKEYWNTDNGKQFELWSEDNGYKNIRSSSASQLNNLFELSQTWKRSLAHLDLKLDNFVVANIKNVTQDEIDNYKTKILASVKAQVEKYVPNVVENTHYKIMVDNLVAGDWTESRDVKVQAVEGNKKLLSLTTKTIPLQQKEQQNTPSPIAPKKLNELIKTTDLGNIINNNDDTIFSAVNQKNRNVIDDFSQITIEKKDNKSATLSSIEGSKSYNGSVDVTYNVVPLTVVDLQIDVTPTSSNATVTKDYLGQIDDSNITNSVNTFYYANSESVITLIKPTASIVITGVVYGCDDKWNKTSQSSTIDPTNGIKLDGSQLATKEGKYVVELSDNLGHTNNVYLQIANDKKIANYFDTDNGKQFEIWAKANGHDNIRGYSASQLNKLFEDSENWQQLASDSQFASAVAFLLKTNGKLSSTESLTKEQVIEQLKLQITSNIIIPDVNTSNYDVNKVSFELNQSEFNPNDKVNITVKYNNVQSEQFTLQIKDSNTPDNKKKTGLGIWTVFGIVIGSIVGLTLLGWLFKQFVINPFILKPIREKKEKAFAAKTEKDIAQMKKDDEEWEAKQKGDK